MARIQVPKVTGYISTGIDDVAKVAKVVAYLILEPGDSEVGDTSIQGHAYTQIVRR